ncbi:MAG: HAD-IA family hydrolase [Microscillaceae bacterium]|nr:HAD-IA family hydrolase [Microscillaceae bacterium]
MGANPQEISCEALAQAYGERTPRRPHLMPHAREVLLKLQEKYTLHIITNGFPEMQALKMESARIRHFFEHIFTSAETGHKKPRPEMFYFALEKVQAQPEHCLMIGDNPDTDLRGAANAGIPAVFYNPKKQASADIPHTLEIQCLRELLLHL